MFGVETKAAQPLRTGDNICPPSLSVLPSIMVRPLSPLRLFILPSLTPLPSFFFLAPPLQLFSSPHLPRLPSKQRQVIRDAAAAPFFYFCSFHCSLFFFHFTFLKKTYSSYLFHPSQPPLFIDLNTCYCFLSIFFYIYIICAYSFLRMLNTLFFL